MKKAMIDYVKNEKVDEYNTPLKAVTPLIPYIQPSWTVWECTDPGNSVITSALKEQGNKVISTHIKDGYNFFEYQPSIFDCIITNPPYSIKTEFLRRAYEIGKPFAFLLPITALEGIERSELYQKYGLELLILNKRVNYLKEKSVWFNSSWFCWKILPKQLIFYGG